MTYQNYYPATYQPYQNYQQPQQNSINWVQGEGAARAFAVAPGQSVLLMDSDASVFYIKSADQSGMPMPLRIFEYKERTQKVEDKNNTNKSSNYITRDEFEKRLSEIINSKHTDKRDVEVENTHECVV